MPYDDWSDERKRDFNVVAIPVGVIVVVLFLLWMGSCYGSQHDADEQELLSRLRGAGFAVSSVEFSGGWRGNTWVGKEELQVVIEGNDQDARRVCNLISGASTLGITDPDCLVFVGADRDAWVDCETGTLHRDEA